MSPLKHPGNEDIEYKCKQGMGLLNFRIRFVSENKVNFYHSEENKKKNCIDIMLDFNGKNWECGI